MTLAQQTVDDDDDEAGGFRNLDYGTKKNNGVTRSKRRATRAKLISVEAAAAVTTTERERVFN